MRPWGPTVFAVVLGALLIVGILPFHLGSLGLPQPGVPLVPASVSRSSEPTSAVRPATTPSYPLWFNETGLPNGTSWSVAVNGTLDGVVGRIPVGLTPSAVLYDNESGQVFVANSATNNVTVINPSTESVVATIPVGTDPVGLALDPTDDYIYVTNLYSNNVSVLDGSADAVVESIAVGTNPFGVAVNPVNDTVYVANAGYFSGKTGASNVTLINGTLLETVGSIRVGVDPRGVTYDPQNGLVYVANYGSGDLTIINASTNRTVGSIPLRSGSDPETPTIDYATGNLYVSGYTSNGQEFVVNTSTQSLMGTWATGAYPSPALYDGVNGYLYVGHEESTSVSIINPGTGSQVGTIPVDSSPRGLALNNSSSELYIPCGGSNEVVVVNGSYEAGGSSFPFLRSVETNTSATNFGSIEFLLDPGTYSYAVESVPGYLSYPSSGTVNVTVANVTVAVLFGESHPLVFHETGLPNGVSWAVSLQTIHDGVVGTFPVGPNPAGVLYDGLNEQGYVAIPGSDNVTVFDAVDNLVTGTIPVGSGPEGLALDSGNDYVFVTNSLSDNVSVVDGQSGTVVRSISVGVDPVGAVEVPANGLVYVVNHGPGNGNETTSNLSVINGETLVTTASIPAGEGAQAICYDSADGFLYVADAGTSSLLVLDPTTSSVVTSIGLGTGAVPSAPAVDNTTGDLYVANGEPSGDVYVINPSNGYETVAVLPVGSGPTDPFYDPLNGLVYVADRLGDEVSVINSTTNSVAGSIPLGTPPGAVAMNYVSADVYVASISTGEIWVVNGSAWEGGVANISVPVTLSDVPVGGSGSVQFTVTNGLYLYRILAPSGYLASPSNGYATVNGSGSVTIAFTPVPYSTLVFVETGGLPTGKSWTLILNGRAQSTYSNSFGFEESAGTYQYIVIGPAGRQVRGIPATGSITLNGSGGSGPTEQFEFVKAPTYHISFHESGLPVGVTWCVTIGVPICSTQGTVSLLDLSPGSYPYSVERLPSQTISTRVGATALPLTGNLSLVSHSVTVNVEFTHPYEVTFVENGLPTGTDWSIRVGSLRNSSTSDAIGFLLTNGSHGFRILSITGYVHSGSPSAVHVTGQPTVVAIVFEPAHRGSSPSSPRPSDQWSAPAARQPDRESQSRSGRTL